MPKNNVLCPPHDNLSPAFEGLVPKEYCDTDQFLNIVQWNVEWFGAKKSRNKDERRIELITDKKVRGVLKEIKETISDHLPTITQSYFEPPNRRPR